MVRCSVNFSNVPYISQTHTPGTSSSNLAIASCSPALTLCSAARSRSLFLSLYLSVPFFFLLFALVHFFVGLFIFKFFLRCLTFIITVLPYFSNLIVARILYCITQYIYIYIWLLPNCVFILFIHFVIYLFDVEFHNI